MPWIRSSWVAGPCFSSSGIRCGGENESRTRIGAEPKFRRRPASQQAYAIVTA